MTVTIRTYEARDAEVVWALHLEGVRDGRADHPELDYAGHEEDLRDIESAYLSPGSNFWVAEVDGLLVGMAAIQRIDAETGRLRRMREAGMSAEEVVEKLSAGVNGWGNG